MKKTSNRGVSLIEILIAVLVFVICITPIIHQLATSIRIGQMADDQQAATDYGRALSESIKQADMDALINLEAGTVDKVRLASLLQMEPSDLSVSCKFYSVTGEVDADGNAVRGAAIPDGSYIIHPTSATDMSYGSGTGYASVTAIFQALRAYNASVDADHQEAMAREYVFTGSTRIDYRDYNIKVVMNTDPYAIASLNKVVRVEYDDENDEDVDIYYSDPNAINLGNLSSLNSETTAVITSVSNYDAVATASYFNAICSALEQEANQNYAAAQAAGEGTSQYNSYMAAYTSTMNILTQVRNGNRSLGSSATKKITITLDYANSADNPDTNGYWYDVTCTLDYDNPTLGTDYGVGESERKISYTIFSQSFKNLPDVYMMYNQFLFSSRYGDDEINITNNTSGKTLKVYVVRTAETDASIQSVANVNLNSGGAAVGGASSLLPSSSYSRDLVDAGQYLYMTNFILTNNVSTYPVEIYTNIPVKKTNGSLNVAGVLNSSGSIESNRTVKMNINLSKQSGGETDDVYAERLMRVIKDIKDDERYSDSGRTYDIKISLTNTRTGAETKFDTSKGDY